VGLALEAPLTICITKAMVDAAIDKLDESGMLSCDCRAFPMVSPDTIAEVLAVSLEAGGFAPKILRV
jgi:hypothetical protein